MKKILFSVILLFLIITVFQSQFNIGTVIYTDQTNSYYGITLQYQQNNILFINNTYKYYNYIVNEQYLSYLINNISLGIGITSLLYPYFELNNNYDILLLYINNKEQYGIDISLMNIQYTSFVNMKIFFMFK